MVVQQNDLVHRNPTKTTKSSVDKNIEGRWVPPPGTWDPDLPYGGKVMLARRKKADAVWMRTGQVVIVVVLGCALCYCYYDMDNVVFNIHRAYAHFGHTEAKHGVAQRYLQGIGTKKNRKKAMQWFQEAAKDGHVESSYNLAVAHLKGHTKLPEGHAHKLIKEAASKGLREAHYLLQDICTKRSCD